MDYIPVLLILIPVVASMVVYLTYNKYGNYIVFISQGTITILAIKFFRISEGFKEPVFLNLGNWNQTVGIVLKNDNLSFAFISLTIIMWWAAIFYCWKIRGQDSKFMFLLMFLEGIYLGMLQTNDIFNLFVFIELTTIVSTILILYKRDGFSVRAGLYYLLFNSVGILFYLLGMVMIYNLVGTLNIELLTEELKKVDNIRFLTISYIFIMAAVGVKSAFFPVFNWLPKAHSAAPSSISALLSGLLVKAGLYVFIRMNQMYTTVSLGNFFLVLGFFSALIGVMFALSQKDMKQILAFHTVSQVGIMMIGLNLTDKTKTIGGLMHIFNHAFFKSLLFLGAGVIITRYNKRKVTEIRGVFKKMPLVSILMIIGMLSISGAPMFNGYVSKTIIKYGIKGNIIAEYAFSIINLGTIISFLKMSQIFLKDNEYSRKITVAKKERFISVKTALAIPGVFCIILGIFYTPIVSYIFNIDISYVHSMEISSMIGYLINVGIGFIIYKFIIEKDYKFIKVIRHTNISFSTSNYLLILYIFIMMIWKW
ncbi:MAG: proton-conducting transporter membrane subunit [Bacillota bacterium]|nr:proton-conducting transporter membrane subunit [Bacillota bacterium]